MITDAVKCAELAWQPLNVMTIVCSCNDIYHYNCYAGGVSLDFRFLAGVDNGLRHLSGTKLHKKPGFEQATVQSRSKSIRVLTETIPVARQKVLREIDDTCSKLRSARRMRANQTKAQRHWICSVPLNELLAICRALTLLNLA